VKGKYLLVSNQIETKQDPAEIQDCKIVTT